MFWLKTSFLCKTCEFVDDFVETLFRLFSCIHFVHSTDHLSDTESVRKQSMLTCLAFSGEGCLETSLVSREHEECNVGLRGTGDHVLDEISMAWGIDDGLPLGLGDEFEDRAVDGDTSFTLCLEFVHDPSEFE